MQLKALEIQGFKSFPDKTRLSFGSGITAVVGPNGSGKSNISDAVRWVLGEKSNKNLRGTKMEDVIFNGTDTRKPLGFAEVTLVLDNESRELPFDGDEISVTRRYFRSGESEYLINGAAVRLRDIHELFMDTGLGQDGYSIIGQGKISEIVSARSEERREIFDEAAGISKYRSKKEESERHLKAAEDNLERLLDILNELESRVEPLRKQSEQAKKFLEYDGKRRELEIGLALINLDKTGDQLREIEYKIETVRAQYDGVTSFIEGADAEMENMSDECQRIAASIDEARRNAAGYEDEARNAESEVAVIRNDISRDGDMQSRIEEDISKMLKSADFDDVIEERKSRIEAGNKEISRLEQEISAVEEQLTSSMFASDRLTGELEEISRKHAKLTVAAGEARVKSESLHSSAEELEASAAEATSRRDMLADRVSISDSELTALKSVHDKERERLDSLKNSESGYSMKLDGRRRKLSEKEEEVRTLELKISEKKQRADMLRNMERRFEGFGNSVKAVMQEAQHGKLNGIIGPVSKILSVDERYSTAIETALGGALQNIVVNTEDDAKNAIAFLKRQDAGRATFLPITSVKGTTMNEPDVPTMPGFVDYAYKLVSYESRFDGIAKSLLGRIAVVTDMNAGIAVARAKGYKFRIVTLDGQLINAGGSFTGGSVVKNAGILTRGSDIEKLEKEADSLQNQLDAARDALKMLTEETSSVEAAFLGLRAEMQTANENLIRLNGDIRLKEEQLAGARSMLESLEEQAAADRKRAAALKEEAGRIDESVVNISEEISEAEEKISQVTGNRSEIAKAREEQSSAVSEMRMSVYRLKNEIENDLAYIEEVNARRAENEDRIRGFRAEIENIAGKKTQAEKKIGELLAQIGDCRAKAAGEKERERELIEKSNMLERSINLKREEQRGKYGDKEKLSAENTRLEERRNYLMSEHDRVIGKLLSDYELTRTEAEKIAPKIDDPTSAAKNLADLKNKIKALGAVNVNAIEEYKEVHARYTELKMQYDDVEKSRAELSRIINDITSKMKDIFSEEFVKINLNFSETFRELFGGGNASLKLTDPDDVLTSGIEINVAPPGKIIRNLASLSGGEQALVAMAIYFAILKVRPAPFCIVDEVETALDDVNVSRFASYMRKMSDNTQFIAITHRRGTMEEADVLYGVTMQEEGVTKLLVMNVSELDSNEDIKAVVK